MYRAQPVDGVHFRIDPFSILIELTLWRADHVILICNLTKEISERIQAVTIKEGQSALGIPTCLSKTCGYTRCGSNNRGWFSSVCIEL